MRAYLDGISTRAPMLLASFLACFNGDTINRRLILTLCPVLTVFPAY